MSYKDKPQLRLYKFIDSAFVLQAIIDDFQEISFERNLYQAGTFTITINYNIPNSHLFQRGMFVQFGNDSYDFGEIITITDTIGADGKGSQIRTITGYDARYILKRRVIKNMNSNGLWNMTDKGELCLRNLIKDQCGSGAEAKRQLPIINTIPASADAIGKEYSVSEQFTNLYEVCKTIATQSEIGWRLAFDGTSLTLECYEGTDRSQTVQFSTSFDSLANGEFSDSSESFSNAIYVGGKGDNEERDIYEGENGTPSGLDRFESFDNQSSMTTESEYEAEALSMLTQYGQTIQMSGNGLAKCPYIYKEQYDVGDLITVAFSGRSAVVQILSVTEHWTWGNYNIQFSFGKPQNNLSEQLQLMLRKIQSASNKEKATESVKWYNIANVNSMPASDVTFNTIGFTGNLTANKTFTFYLDDEKTGAKSYNIYVKNLSGSFTLTLTTGRAGKTNYVLKGGVNLTGRILVDDEGNITSQSVTATSVIESGNNQPATSGGVASAISSEESARNTAIANAINSLGITNVGTTSFKARKYENMLNNTDYEFADIKHVFDGVTALVSINTMSTGNVCTSLWLISTGNQDNSCGITLLCKTGYNANNNQKLTVNFNAGGSCSLVIKLGSVGQFVGNPQAGYISVLCFNGELTLKEKTTTLTPRSYSKFLETQYKNTNEIATDTEIKAVTYASKKSAVLVNYGNATSTIKYIKISGIITAYTENVFMLQSRAGELYIISIGHGDQGILIAPRIKQLLNVYSKIGGFKYSGTDIYIKIMDYSHECILSQICGSEVVNVGFSEITEATYEAGTPITIEN